MKNSSFKITLTILGLCCLLGGVPLDSSGKDRIQIELYGGISLLNPKDFNMLSKAEEEYNELYFIQPQLYKQGYFVNVFPRIKSMIPAGVRLKYWMSQKLSFSLSAEVFNRKVTKKLEGTMSYVQSYWFDNQTKIYDPYRLGLSGIAVMGGLHYRIPVGNHTDVEFGASAGWAKANIDFSSTWAHSIHFWAEDYWEFISADGGTLNGDGTGNGLITRLMIRINRSLGKRLGFFVEAAGTYCRMKSIEGSGSEIRLGIPGESNWEGRWGIKKEEIEFSSETKTIQFPTNYWGGWTGAQKERDFILDLSRVQLVIGFYIKL
ncbi:hypothetical protein ACFLT9_08130 [Acidobacteriota bacterium]